MKKEIAIRIFEQNHIRTHWDEEQEKGCFFVVDVLSILKDSIDLGLIGGN